MPNPIRRRRLGSVAFDPRQIAGLSLWYMPASLGLADGAAVASWTDSSVRAYTVSQATGSARPTYKAGILNGYPVVRFLASSLQFLQGAAFPVALSQPLTIVAVANDVVNALNRAICDGILTSNRAALFFGGTPTDSMSIFGGATLAGASNVTAFHVHTALFNGTGSTLWLDGAQSATGSAGTNTVTGFMIGGAFNGSNTLNSDLAELLVYNAQLTTGQQKSIERYLGAKYRIAVS